MKAPTLKIFSLAVLGAACILPASAAVSDTVGYNTIPCLVNSDTIVGVPLRQSGSIKGVLGALPDIADPPAEAATLILSAPATEGIDDLEASHYIQFTSGSNIGQYFTIMANGIDPGYGDAYTVDIDTNGADLSGVSATDTFIIAKFWTLDELFPPGAGNPTNAWDPETNEPNGHAIVASDNPFTSGRKTEVILPDHNFEGINAGAGEIYYIYSGKWRKQAQPAVNDFGGTMLAPNAYLTIRHPALVDHPTNFTSVGEVSDDELAHSLTTTTLNSGQDNFIALTRPIDVELNDLGLITSNAFVASDNPFTSGRKDELFVYDNSAALINKSPSLIYYYYSGAWRKQGVAATESFNTAVIPAGSGFIIRKSKGSGSTVEWVNPANY